MNARANPLQGLTRLLLLGALALPAAGQDGLAPGALEPGRASPLDENSERLAFVELTAERDTYLVQEPFRLRLSFGFEARFRAQNLVPLFSRAMDLPVQIEAPWLGELAGSLVAPAEQGSHPSFALGETLVRALRASTRARDGRTFDVFELEWSYLPTTPGPLRIEGPLLRFAHAARFADDFVNGRVALDRSESLLRADPLALTILALPEEGRPLEFSGAVGTFTLRATAEPRELELGQSLKLVLTIEGRGELDSVQPPRLDDLEGFHVQGSFAERGPQSLTATYELVPLDAELSAVPPIRFAFFDRTPPAGYRTVTSAAIPLRVRPAAAPSEVEAAGAPAGGGSWTARSVALASLGVLVVLGLALLLRRRARANA